MKVIEREPQSYWDDLEWAREHSTELHRKYEDPDGGIVWLAIVNKEVVAHGPNLAEVERIAAERTGKPIKEIAIKFIESGAAIYDQTTL
jgi:hypothetical protein